MIDPMTGMMLGQAAGSILGNIFGGGKDEAAAAADAQRQALAIVNSIPNLSNYDQQIIYQKLIAGQPLNPEQEQAVAIGKSKVAQIQEDPGLQNTQKQALEMLRGVSQSGIRPEDRAALNQVRQQVAQDAEAKRQQILQSMQARGMGGSGAELAAALSSSQAGIQREAEQSDRLAAQASQRALEALSGMGSMAGQIRSQNFDVAKTTGGAEDAFRRFDVENQISNQQRNVDRTTQANIYNQNRQNQTSDANINQTNQELTNQRARQLQQAEYNRQVAAMKAAALTGQAKNLYDQSNAARKSSEQLGSGLGQLGGFGASKLSGMSFGGGSSAKPEGMPTDDMWRNLKSDF